MQISLDIHSLFICSLYRTNIKLILLDFFLRFNCVCVLLVLRAKRKIIYEPCFCANSRALAFSNLAMRAMLLAPNNAPPQCLRISSARSL